MSPAGQSTDVQYGNGGSLEPAQSQSASAHRIAAPYQVLGSTQGHKALATALGVQDSEVAWALWLLVCHQPREDLTLSTAPPTAQHPRAKAQLWTNPLPATHKAETLMNLLSCNCTIDSHHVKTHKQPSSKGSAS